jgi:hypothetical protein
LEFPQRSTTTPLLNRLRREVGERGKGKGKRGKDRLLREFGKDLMNLDRTSNLGEKDRLLREVGKEGACLVFSLSPIKMYPFDHKSPKSN